VHRNLVCQNNYTFILFFYLLSSLILFVLFLSFIISLAAPFGAPAPSGALFGAPGKINTNLVSELCDINIANMNYDNMQFRVTYI